MPLTLKDKPLENFQEFQDWLEDNNLFHDDNILYRGQANSVWPLESTLYRHRRNRLLASGIEEPDRSPHIDYLATEYLKSATKLQAIIEALTGHRFGDITKDGTAFPFTTKATEGREKARSDEDIGRMSLEYAIYLRHHGCPSPLLDWTWSRRRAVRIRVRYRISRDCAGAEPLWSLAESSQADRRSKTHPENGRRGRTLDPPKFRILQDSAWRRSPVPSCIKPRRLSAAMMISSPSRSRSSDTHTRLVQTQPPPNPRPE